MSSSTDKPREKYGRGKHPNSLANLKVFKKGEPSGNPKGRPRKENCITSLVKERLDELVPNDKQKRTWAQVIADALMVGAMKNPALMKELLDRMEGKVPLPVTGEDGGPIHHALEFNVADAKEAKKIKDLATKGL